TGLCRHNVRDLSVDLQLGALNLITGLSGAGKTSLLAAVTAQLQAGAVPDAPFRRIVAVDADPIGRTPRSNAATYTGAFDLLRDRFAGSDDARRLGLGKSHFSFNTAGGRCEACEGAGVREVGMRYLGSVDLLCETCGGRRFHPDVLAVKVQGRSIAEVLEGSIAEAAAAFSDHPRLKRILGALLDVGLGYLPLGQPATTLSGGEAQRVKLAAELAKAAEGPALIVLDEPTTGLHAADVRTLLEAWNRLLDAGHTLLVADHDLDVIQKAHHIVDLGPGSGPEGGTVVAAGPPEALRACESSLTGAALREPPQPPPAPTPAARIPPIELRGVRTHTLQGLDLTLPPRGLIAVTGPSGSGKSSLVFDTLLAEAQARFADLVSPWARRLLPRTGGAELEAARGLQATLAVPAQRQRRNPRATVGTATELDGRLRLLFSRAGTRPCPACGRPAEEDRCPCGQILPALWTSDFSPQSERGACPTCRGLGLLQRCDPERLVTRPDLPLEGGALAGTRYGATLGEADGQFMAILRHAAAQAGLDLSRPWRDLGSAERALAMAGTGETSYDVAWRYRRGRSEGIHRLTTPWDGLARLVEREYERIHADPRGEELEALMRDVPCPDCGGERLREPARRVTFAGTRLPELSAWPAEAVESWLRSLEGRLAPRIAGLTAGLRQDLLDGLSALSDAGLGYLSLNRELASLSGGEAQRVRLAASLGGGFSGVTYVLDEPSRGLHARDVDRLGNALRRLADAGNAVIVIEHDPALIARADHVMELGPGSGPEGGRLVAAGSPAELQRHPGSRTGAPLRSRRSAGSGREPHPGIPAVKLTNVQARNLQGFDVVLPAGALVCVTGVSGSGKSTFLLEVLAPSLRNHLRGQGAVGCAAFEALVDFQQVLTADQEGLGVAWNSTVLSLTGLGDTLRKRFAATPEAKARKLSARHFSTASPGGRCEACEGRGHLVIPMDLLPDVTVGCEACEGRRFRPEVLACRLHGRTLAEFLEATVGELGPILEGDPNLAPPLKALREVGLGYLRLGQEGSALSEGERQRLRLASLLADPFCGRTAILLDEPTRGLGFEDAARLADTLRSLAQSGHLVVTVTHDLGFIAASDWILDLGPEAGEAGGRLLVSGPPDAVRACPDSFTGQALRQR
ncbi:MAG TPA: hypothetical protein VF768_03675, partial [Holophagaceae bacterium]